MQTSDAQGNMQAGLFKANAVSEESLSNVVAEVCKWFSERFGNAEVGDLEETVKASVEEVLDSAVGEDGLVRAVSLILSLKAFFKHCGAFNEFLRNKLASVIDSSLTIRDKERTVLKVPPEVISKAVASAPSFEELREAVVKSIALGVAKPLTIAALRELAREGKVSVLFDSRRHRYQVTLKLRDLFTDEDVEVVIPLSNATINVVLKYGHKVDEKPKKGKKREDEDVNPLFDFVPSILEPYTALFLKHGWVPDFSSIEFVKFILEVESKDKAVFNTTRDELRALLLNALKKFRFTKVTYKDGARLYDPLIVTNPKEFTYVDEDNKELIVPSRFYAEVEVRSGYKSAVINLLVREGLLKTKHTTYTFARKDKPEDKTVLNVAVFSLDKLTELLGFDPRDLMKTGELDIAKLIELKEGRAGDDENVETQ